MAYPFTFDLTSVPSKTIRKVCKLVLRKGLHVKLSTLAEKVVKTLKLDEITGLPFVRIAHVVRDILEIERMNMENMGKVKNANKKALLLPHCARKYMDSRCKAVLKDFYYECAGCSPDCLVKKACDLAVGVDVYVLPGGSCLPRVLEKGYDRIIGVACSDEIKLGGQYLETLGIPYVGVPLLKNGCSGTVFDLDVLKDLLSENERIGDSN